MMALGNHENDGGYDDDVDDDDVVGDEIEQW